MKRCLSLVVVNRLQLFNKFQKEHNGKGFPLFNIIASKEKSFSPSNLIFVECLHINRPKAISETTLSSFFSFRIKSNKCVCVCVVENLLKGHLLKGGERLFKVYTVCVHVSKRQHSSIKKQQRQQ